MKRNTFKYIVLVLLLSFVSRNETFAQEVSRSTAKRVAETFLNQNVRGGRGASVQLRDITAETEFQNFYIFSADSGFVLVAADERVIPILGYSKTGPFVTEDMPENLRSWLEGYERQIQFIIDNHVDASDKAISQWNDLKVGRIGGMRTLRSVGPLTNTEWGQQGYVNGHVSSPEDKIDLYNQQCPVYDVASGKHCITGCSAIDMAQVMRYWQHPNYSHGSKEYEPSNPHYPQFYPLFIDLDNQSYDWSKMPVFLSSETPQDKIDETARFIYNCAASIGSNFGDQATGASLSDIHSSLVNYFFYKSSASCKTRSNYSDEEWKQMLIDELSASPGRPVCYRGDYDNGTHAHSLVCDGYATDEDDYTYFHFNFGWYGSSSGYWSIDALHEYALSYIENQAAIFGIEPDEGTITATVYPEGSGMVVGSGTYRKGTLRSLTALPNDNYVFLNWTKNGEIVSTEPEYAFVVTEDVAFIANFTCLHTINVEAMPTIGGIVEGGGTYFEGELCTVTATPNPGYMFKGWYTPAGLFPINPLPTFTFTVSSNLHLIAKFIPATPTTDVYQYYCWFDQDFSTVQTGSFQTVETIFSLDASALNEGLHTLHVMLDDNGLSAPKTYLFLKTPTVSPTSTYTYHCWFNQDYGTLQTGTFGGEGYSFALDANELEEGIHTVHVMLEGNDLSASKTYIFLKAPVASSTETYTYHCWFDQDYETVQTGSFGGEGYSFALDVDGLDNGLHFVNVMLKGNELSSAKRYLFCKKPIGGSGIYRWEYCLNGQWSDAVATTLVPTVQTLDILTMLPVDHLPIRSEDFEFEPNGGQPEIYAKNAITFRFWDDENRFLDRSAVYVDANVHEPVVADWIQRNTTETIATPAANHIHWFKLDAEVGDSLAFKSDVYCTMELFAPSGARQFKVMNAASVAFNGICANESGIYYLAVHDVEGSYENVSVTYLFLREMTAVTALNAGWNWWTPTVWTDISTLQSTLSDYLIQIQVQDEMPTGNINPGKMLKIQTSAACALSLRGMPITAASITVNPGATWFGYIGEEAPITQALNGFPPSVDDKIISQDGGFAVFNGDVWEGTLQTLVPGHGYVYVSNSATSKTLVIGE